MHFNDAMDDSNVLLIPYDDDENAFPSIKENQTSVCIDDYSQHLHITANTAMTLGATDIYDDIVQTASNLNV
jgi:hypothetical protein